MNRYEAIRDFVDLTDNNHLYHPGDQFPWDGRTVNISRLTELLTGKNRLKKPVIRKAEKVETPVEQPVEPKIETPVEATDRTPDAETHESEAPVETPVEATDETPVETPVAETPESETPVEAPVETPVAETPESETPVETQAAAVESTAAKKTSRKKKAETAG